ncbi:MAG: hypothetical protein ACREBD_00125 [Blastocatellia bacterium]
MRKLFLTSFIVMAFGLVLSACVAADTSETASAPKTKMTDSEDRGQTA